MEKEENNLTDPVIPVEVESLNDRDWSVIKLGDGLLPASREALAWDVACSESCREKRQQSEEVRRAEERLALRDLERQARYAAGDLARLERERKDKELLKKLEKDVVENELTSMEDELSRMEFIVRKMKLEREIEMKNVRSANSDYCQRDGVNDVMKKYNFDISEVSVLRNNLERLRRTIE